MLISKFGKQGKQLCAQHKRASCILKKSEQKFVKKFLQFGQGNDFENSQTKICMKDKYVRIRKNNNFR
jgi:hypothetical protein